MALIIGLGNPGRRYEETRHNAGFLVADRLGDRWGAACARAQLGALVGTGLISGVPVVLAKPQGFMNLSGQPATSLKGYYKVELDQIIVIHDDLDLEFGTVRVKKGGGHGGHNGLRDLNQKIGSGFVRVRFGVSRPPEGWDAADYVLGKWSEGERAQLPDLVDLAADAVEAVLRDGAQQAMTTFNARQPQRHLSSMDA
ncbi:MAG: aminoacyl-tRNA hydrolase [Deltaproteobacteria bacterium]|nr:aminoacyl-tRNA hydrolase [Deltaproteobacteria bacterium]